MAKTIVFLSLPLLLLTTTTTTLADTTLQYYQFSDSSTTISVLGDARIFINDLALELTNTSAGRATYDYPVRMLTTTPSTTSISFETSFIFSIETDPLSYGSGLTFHITSDNKTIESTPRFLGLATSNPNSPRSLPSPKYFAIEFDTHQDAELQDLNDNHVGIDINSLVSNQAKPATSGSTPVALASGMHIQAYVSYNSLEHVLDVSISPYVNGDYVKPEVALLSVPVDLSGVFEEFMYVGFSAATGAGTVKHKIWSWTFQTTTVDAMGMPVASAPDNWGEGAGAPGPGPEGYDRPFGDSGGAKGVPLNGSWFWVRILGLVFVLVIGC